MKQNKKQSLKDKTIIFTGGSGYLGKAMILHLLGCGARVINLGRRKPKIPQVHAEKFCQVTVDFYKTDLLVAKLKKLISENKTIDILVNNSFDFSVKTGFNHPSGKIENLSKKTFLRGVESGIYWPLLCAQIIGQKMIKQRSGNIINIASLYAFLVADYRIYKGRKIFNPVIYPIAKHGLLGLNKYLASFWSEYNIRCNCLSPGTFPNPGSSPKSRQEPNKVQDQEFMNILSRKCSLGRVGVPDDLLSALEFLCSDKSAYITGSNIVVDGGWSVI
jgi:gluconate 5-dehydrogenase